MILARWRELVHLALDKTGSLLRALQTDEIFKLGGIVAGCLGRGRVVDADPRWP